MPPWMPALLGLCVSLAVTVLSVGISWGRLSSRIEAASSSVEGLRRDKASAESVASIKERLDRFEDDLKEEIRSLRDELREFMRVCRETR
jgi:Flp pilus assembly protein TadB